MRHEHKGVTSGPPNICSPEEEDQWNACLTLSLHPGICPSCLGILMGFTHECLACMSKKYPHLQGSHCLTSAWACRYVHCSVPPSRGIPREESWQEAVSWLFGKALLVLAAWPRSGWACTFGLVDASLQEYGGSGQGPLMPGSMRTIGSITKRGYRFKLLIRLLSYASISLEK